MILFGWLVTGGALGFLATKIFNFAETSNPTFISNAHKASKVAFFAVLILAIVFAIDQYVNCPLVYALETFLLRPRFLSLSLGLFVGLFVSLNTKIHNWMQRLSRSMMGEAKHASWILQSGLALIVILILAVLIKPDLLDKFESIKAGEVEAKFNKVSPLSASALNSIEFNSTDLFRSSTIDDWANFAPSYAPAKAEDQNDGCDNVFDRLKSDLANQSKSQSENQSKEETDKGAPRQAVVLYFSNDANLDSNKLRMNTACIFFKYMSRVATTIKCFREKGAIESIKRSPELSRIIYDEQNFLIDPVSHASSLEDAFKAVMIFDHTFQCSSSTAFSQIVHPNWTEEKNALVLDKNDAGRISEATAKTDADRISKIVKKGGIDKIDPYIVNFVGDALGFCADQETEAEFLNATIDRYLSDLYHPHPGLVSLYFAISNAKLRSVMDWPLEDLLQNLDRSDELDDIIVGQARNYKGKSGIPETVSDKILGAYNGNHVFILSQYIQTFVLASLGGIDLNRGQQAKWSRTFGELQSILNVLEGDSTVTLENYPRPSFTDAEKKEWKDSEIEKEDHFDFAINIALSAILLTQQEGKSPAQACATSRYYLSIADKTIDNVAEKFSTISSAKIKIGTDTPRVEPAPAEAAEDVSKIEPNKYFSMKKSYQSRLKAYLLSAQHRIDIACD